MDLGGFYHRGRGGPGGWVILDEPELHLGFDILVPDLAGWKKERFPRAADDEAYFTVAPDWVCEVLGPRTAKRDRFAQRLHLTTTQESLCLSLLVDSGQALWNGHHYEPREVTAVDARQDRDAARALAVFWAQQGVNRLTERGLGHFAYNVVAVSALDFERLRELQRTYFAQMRAIVASSTPVECVAVMNLQLFPIATQTDVKVSSKIKKREERSDAG